jgi:hypothetical protein
MAMPRHVRRKLRGHAGAARLKIRAFGEWVVLDGKDKVLHFLAMMAASGLLGIVYGTLISSLACGSMSMAKEIYDRKVKKEDIDLGDLTADCIGIITGIAIVFYVRVMGLA